MSDFEYYACTKRDEVIDFFNQTIGCRPCHLCGTGELLILGDEHGLITIDHDVNVFNPEANNQKESGVFSSYVVMCENCGCQQFINVKKLEESMNRKAK